jgi:DMSO/TMAO reductase YedYZ heme-binding membrane subunit
MTGHGPSVLWYATRGTGAITLLLLTASVVLGIGEVRSWRPAGTPRFAVAAMHRTVSLLAVSLLAVHVATTLLDPFPPIGALNAIVPFQTDYRPLWLGLGTVASDLLVALALTSLVRRRLGYRTWRGLHWLAYACWPVALVHGIGAGSDTRSTWMLALAAGCVLAVLVAATGRLVAEDVPPRLGLAAAAAATLAMLALGLWLPLGPLAPGWARRAGTPAAVLAAFSPHRSEPRVRPHRDGFGGRFSATVTGRVHNGAAADGTAVADLRMRLGGSRRGVLRIRLGGRPLPGGGLRMDRSAVTLGPPSDPARYSGRIQALGDTAMRSLVGSADGHALRLSIELSLIGDAVEGHIRGTPVSR